MRLIRLRTAWRPPCGRLALVCSLALLGFAGGCGGNGSDHEATGPTAQRVDPKLAAALQKALDVERAAASLTGVAAAVVIPGEGVWSGGSGLADRATKARVTGRTPFPIASVTKTFVATLAIKLADEGRLRLDDRLDRWLPDWPNADRITLRQLLNHTSGVANFEQRIDGPYQRAVDAHPTKLWSPQQTLSYARKPEFAPGSRWEYNNANYILAGLAIERATGSTVARLLRRELFAPLKLDDVVLQPQGRIRGTPAHGYGGFTAAERRDLRAAGTRFIPYDSLASSAWTGGAIAASAESVARWGDALLRGHILSAAGRKQQQTFIPVEAGRVAYGLGLTRLLSPELATDVLGHDGAVPGFGSSLWHLPGEGITAAVLANANDSSHATRRIAAILIKTAKTFSARS
jgi:D-alanyl-D-alanine carboxypeptidase